MSTLRRIIDWLPRDMSLPEPEFRSRHRALTGMLILHVPILFAYGFLVQGIDLAPLAIELSLPVVAALLGALPMIRRGLRTFAVTTGLIWSSVVLLHLSGGAAEASLHFLIVLAFVFLYREWFLFAWAILLMGFSYTLLELTQGALGVVTTGQPEMDLWALMTAGSIASVGLVLAWKSAADSQAATIAALEVARERDEAAARRDAYGKMYVNLARRSQSLVDRQLKVIDQLEQDVDDPDILANVFELDHLTTRVRRHGESLLVVADVDLPTRSTQPVQLSDIVRGAQSEIEQYRRVDARIDPSIAVAGHATRDLVHLLSELLDNATTYSPPNTTVKVHARSGDAGSVVVTIEDRGLGLDHDRLAQANADLQDTDALDENSIRHLGLRVVARLAAKHDVTVRLTSTNGGGVTAWVEVPATVVVSADTDALAPARLPAAPAAAAPSAPAAADPGSEPVAEPTASAAAAPQAPAAPLVPPAPTAAPAPPTTAPTPLAPPTVPAPPAAPAQLEPAPAASEVESTETPDADTSTESSGPPPAPAPMPAGFSANGRRRRGRRSRTPASTPHDRGAVAQPPPPAPADHAVTVEDPTEPPLRPPTVPAPLPTRAVRIPNPSGSAAASPPAVREPFGAESVLADLDLPDLGAPNGNGHADGNAHGNGEGTGMPPLPRRERGASSRLEAKAKEEALDLFGALEEDAGGGRSSLGDFQRGQESARKEARG